MPYADKDKANEYSKLRMRAIRGSKLARTDKSILEQTYENLRVKEMLEASKSDPEKFHKAVDEIFHEYKSGDMNLLFEELKKRGVVENE